MSNGKSTAPTVKQKKVQPGPSAPPAAGSSAPPPPPTAAGVPPLVHEMRITSQGKMTNYIKFALSHLLDPSKPPLCLHTLPSVPSSSTTATTSNSKPANSKAKAKSSGSASSTVSKLISITEIIKREYEAAVLTSRATAAAPPSGPSESNLKRKRSDVAPEVSKEVAARVPMRLHQYNHFGALESLTEDDAVEETEEVESARHAQIVGELLAEGSGKRKRPRKTHTPFLKVYLSPRPISAFEKLPPEMTYQPPVRPARKRKKAKKGKKDVTMQEADAVDEEQGEDEEEEEGLDLMEGASAMSIAPV